MEVEYPCMKFLKSSIKVINNNFPKNLMLYFLNLYIILSLIFYKICLIIRDKRPKINFDKKIVQVTIKNFNNLRTHAQIAYYYR